MLQGMTIDTIGALLVMALYIGRRVTMERKQPMPIEQFFKDGGKYEQ